MTASILSKISGKLISDCFYDFYKEGVAVFRYEPTHRMITSFSYDDDLDNDDNFKRYYLSFPAMLFSIHYVKINPDRYSSIKYEFSCSINHSNIQELVYRPTALNVAFTDADPESKKLYIPSLSNIYDNLEVCMNFRPKDHYGLQTLPELNQSVVETFWESQFNDDINSCQEYYIGNKHLKSYKKWAEKTKKNPEWIPHKLIEKSCDHFFDLPKLKQSQHTIDSICRQ